MESSKKKRNSVLPIIVSVGIATSMGVVANSTPEVAYASSNAAASASTSTATTYADRSSSEDDENQVIEFKDPVLKSKLLKVMKEKNIIASDATDITIANAEKLKEANLRNWSVDSLDDSNTIHDLTGLEHFTELVYLNFSGNNVSDLKPLENLTSLEELYFSNNKVSDLKPLENLFLKSLDFSGNQVSDLTPLGVLDSLEDLFFTDNKVSKLDTLQYLHSLKTLDFSRNQVSDLTPLGVLDSLTKLVFDGNQVSDLTSLENLKSLENLLFSDNKVSDLTSLENLKSLKELIFIGNQVSDLSPLENLKKLDTLKMGNQTITIDSNDKETTLPVSDVTFTIQGEEGNSIGSITDGVFTLSKDLPYSGTISIKFQHDNIQIGSATSNYTGIITLNLNVPKTDNGVTTWVIKAKMKYEADPKLAYQQKQQVTAAKDGTKKEYADGSDPVEVSAQDGLTKVGNVNKTTTTIPFKTTYVADNTLDYKKQEDKTAGKDGSTTVTTTYKVNPDTGLTTEVDSSKEDKVDPTDHVVRVGNVNKTTTKIPFKTTYVADNTLDYKKQEDKTAGQNGSKTVTTTYKVNSDTGLTTDVENTKEDKVDPTDHVVRVGNKQVTHEGNKTITTTYDVDPATGNLINPKKKTSMPADTLVGSTKTEVLHGVMKYEADETLPYNTQKKISDPVDGKRVTKSNGVFKNGVWVEGTPSVNETAAQDGLTKVGNKEVINNADGSVTTNVYEVNPTTGALSNSKTTVTPAPSRADGEAIEPQFAAMYRLYNPYTHEHLFTTDAAEKDNLVSLGWNFENVTGKVYMHGEKGGVYRLYNPTTGEHHYTTNEDELAKCVKAGWRNEGVKFFSVLDADKQTVGMVSMYNPYEKKFYHHYTSDPDEIAKMVKDGWRKEDVKWYAAK